MDQVYCGPPPTPQTLVLAWTLDPAAIALGLALVAVHFRQGGDRRTYFWVGIGLFGLLFLSPLCALTSALFSARAVHHVLLIAVVAPLLAMAFPRRAAPRRLATFGLVPLGLVALIHAGVLWVWHAPEVYERAIFDPALYWIMQMSLLSTGFWLWRGVLDRHQPTGTVLLVLLGTIVQMGMLGALLVFAGAPLYAPHFASTSHFGLSPLEDQQLAGLIMWVPAALPYLAAGLYRAALSLGESGAPGRAGVWFG